MGWLVVASALAVFAMLAGVHVSSFFGGFTHHEPELDLDDPYFRSVFPAPSEHVRAPPADNGPDARALATSLLEAGVEEPLLLFFTRGDRNVYGLSTTGGQAIVLWMKLRTRTERTG